MLFRLMSESLMNSANTLVKKKKNITSSTCHLRERKCVFIFCLCACVYVYLDIKTKASQEVSLSN